MRALCAHTAGDIKDEVRACEDKENEKDCMFCLGFTLCYSLVLGVESKTRRISVCYTNEVHSMLLGLFASGDHERNLFQDHTPPPEDAY